MYFLVDHLRMKNRNGDQLSSCQGEMRKDLGSHHHDISAVTPVQSQRQISFNPSGFNGDSCGDILNNCGIIDKETKNILNCVYLHNVQKEAHVKDAVKQTPGHRLPVRNLNSSTRRFAFSMNFGYWLLVSVCLLMIIFIGLMTFFELQKRSALISV